MRTTLILDDARLAMAMRLTGLTEKTAVVHAGLDLLIARASARRLARLGATDRTATAAPRPRPGATSRRSK